MISDCQWICFELFLLSFAYNLRKSAKNIMSCFGQKTNSETSELSIILTLSMLMYQNLLDTQIAFLNMFAICKIGTFNVNTYSLSKFNLNVI